MTTNTVALEEQVSIIAKTLEYLVKAGQERDTQFAMLMNRVEQLGETSQIAATPQKLQEVAEFHINNKKSRKAYN
uniref:hypothetical protein n=1 Tax=Bartonella sp. AC134YNZD TaxID=3243446 RepID=UPI0035D0CEB5